MTPKTTLSRRERQVAALVAEGLTNREIAERLYIAERTADGHLEHIREKLGFKSRAQIASWVTRQASPPPMPVALGNIPDARTSFVGRDQELAELKRGLAGARMLTLTGAGGCGKTRLAVEAARTVRGEFPDGAWLTELSPVHDPALVPSTVAASLGLPEDPTRDSVELLTNSLHRAQLLLVLDNCEQVLDATAELCEQFLRLCPEVRILATSRQALGVVGERCVPLLPLAVAPEGADADGVAHSESGRLFLERARAVLPSVEINNTNADFVRSICQRLDGIPLAIELAAARVGFLTPREIDQRLDDRFRLLTSGSRNGLPHHRTLRALIDWSFDLLGQVEAVVYRRLGVFVGGFTLEAAEQVCSGKPLATDGVLDALAQLVQRSLVATEELGGRTRYHMLETIRDHALEHLKASGEEGDIRARHVEWFVGFVERFESEVPESNPLEAVRRTEREFGNIRAAFNWGLGAGNIEAALRLVANRRFWQSLQGYSAEGRDWFEIVLPLADGADPPLRARVLAMAGELQRVSGQLNRARDLLDQALSIQRPMKDIPAVGRSLQMLGRVELTAGRMRRAYELTEEGVAIARGVAEPGLAERLAQLGEIAYALRSTEQSIFLLNEALRVAREAGDAHSAADALRVLAMIARDDGRFEEAQSSLGEAITLQRRIADPVCVSLSLSVFGDIALMNDRPAHATELFAEALTLQRQVGYRFAIADSLWGLAAAAEEEGALLRAARLLGADEAIRRETAVPFRIGRQERHDSVLSTLRTRVTHIALADALREGRSMTLDGAATYALEESAPASSETL